MSFYTKWFLHIFFQGKLLTLWADDEGQSQTLSHLRYSCLPSPSNIGVEFDDFP